MSGAGRWIRATFAFTEFSEVGQGFIGNSSPLASVRQLIYAGLITPPLLKGDTGEVLEGRKTARKTEWFESTGRMRGIIYVHNVDRSYLH